MVSAELTEMISFEKAGPEFRRVRFIEHLATVLSVCLCISFSADSILSTIVVEFSFISKKDRDNCPAKDDEEREKGRGDDKRGGSC